MPYQVVTVPAARRALKKLPKPVRKHIVKAVKPLATKPYLGERLEDQWRFLRSFHTVYRRTHYRVAYEVDEKRKEVIVRVARTRENFYRSLRKMKLKSLAS